MLGPQRLKMLQLLSEPDSAAGLARRLRLPRQQVNYHLRALESAGLVRLAGERRKGNCTERLLQTTARSYLISPEILGELRPSEDQDRFSIASLAGIAARTISELAHLTPLAESAGKRLATLSLNADIRFATPESRARFAAEITEAFVTAIERHHNAEAAGGRSFRIFFGGYPMPTTTQQELPQ